MNAGLTAAVTFDSRLFHALAAATRNARSPSDDLQFIVGGTTSAGELNDLRLWAPLERLVEVARTLWWCQTMLTLERKDT